VKKYREGIVKRTPIKGSEKNVKSDVRTVVERLRTFCIMDQRVNFYSKLKEQKVSF